MNIFITYMHKLLKLSNVAINVSHISKIYLNNDKYTIHLIDFNVDSAILFGTESMDKTSTNTIVEINKHEHSDYFKITDYILKHSI